MMPLKSVPFDAAEFLKTPEEIADYLEEAFADGDPAFIAAALGDAARARDDPASERDGLVA